MDKQAENCPILLDFISYWGRCPVTAQLQLENSIKWGKGTADHMMPLGDWFFHIFIFFTFLLRGPSRTPLGPGPPT